MLDPASVQADDGAGLSTWHHRPRQQGPAAQARRLGSVACVGLGRRPVLSTLPRDRSLGRRENTSVSKAFRVMAAALVTMAFDQRFAMVLVGSSGKGGATLLRRNYGEAVESLTGGEYHWMAGNFIQYGASEASFGRKTPGDIPVDSNELIALCAPRLTFISWAAHSREGRRPLARSSGQLHGDHRRGPRLYAARRQRPRHRG